METAITILMIISLILDVLGLIAIEVCAWSYISCRRKRSD
jgi:hypothetical protein